MADPGELFERQARWQKRWIALSWPEKVRIVEQIRESVLRLRGGRLNTEAPEKGSRGGTRDR